MILLATVVIVKTTPAGIPTYVLGLVVTMVGIPSLVVTAFVKESASAGIDLFRVFDSLNWVPNMAVAIDAVREAGALCEAAIA